VDAPTFYDVVPIGVFITVVAMGVRMEIDRRRDDTKGLVKLLESQENAHTVLVRQTNDLHQWHNVRDSDGNFLWWGRRSLEEAIKDLAENVKEQTETLRGFHSAQQDARRALQTLLERESKQ